MIKNSIFYLYLKYLRWKYFPSETQLLDKKYTQERLLFYQKFLDRGDLCFDVGANVGNRTDIFLKLGARVIAIEPQPICYKTLWIKFGNSITIRKEALGAKSGNGVIYLSDSPEISSLSKSWINAVSKSRFKSRNWGKEMNIKINTLDNLIVNYGVPKFCKIDVEGYEEYVLSGLSNKIPYISFEYTIPERMDSIVKCFDTLSKIGDFDCNFTIGENMSFKKNEWATKEEILNSLADMKDDGLFGDIYIRYK